MATAALTITAPDTHMGAGRTLVAVSASLANADNTASLPTLGFDEGTVIVTGTFGAAGSVAVEGSADGTNWYALPGITNVAIAITAAGAAGLPNLFSRFIRARVTAGDGTTALIVTILLRTLSR